MSRRVKVIKVPSAAQVPPGNITAAEWLPVKDASERLSSNYIDIREFGSVDMTGVVPATDVVQMALNSPGREPLLLPPGRLLFDAPLSVPQSQLTMFRMVGAGVNATNIKSDHAGPFLILDPSATPSSSTRRQYWEIGGFYLSGPGRTVAGSLGLRLNNGLNGRTTPLVVTGFETGIAMESASVASGHYYNAINQPVIFGCVDGMTFNIGTNSNQVFGGAIKQCSGRAVLIGTPGTGGTNNNAFFGTDIEGNTGNAAVEINGNMNHMFGCRFENPGTTYDIHFNAINGGQGERNQIIGNYHTSANYATRIKDDSPLQSNMVMVSGYFKMGDSHNFQNPSVLSATRSSPQSNPFLDLTETNSSSGTPIGVRYRQRRTSIPFQAQRTTDGSTYFETWQMSHNGIGNPEFLAGNSISGLQNRITWGANSPEGVVNGRRGDIFMRTNGAAGTTMYVKESADDTNTGWRGV